MAPHTYHVLLCVVLFLGLTVATPSSVLDNNVTDDDHAAKKNTYRGIHTLDHKVDYTFVRTNLSIYLPDMQHKLCSSLQAETCSGRKECSPMTSIAVDYKGTNYQYCFPDYVPEYWVDLYEIVLRGRCTWATGSNSWLLGRASHFEVFVNRDILGKAITKNASTIIPPETSSREGSPCITDIGYHSAGVVHTMNLRQAKNMAAPALVTCWELPVDRQLNVLTYAGNMAYRYGNYTSGMLRGYVQFSYRQEPLHTATCRT